MNINKVLNGLFIYEWQRVHIHSTLLQSLKHGDRASNGTYNNVDGADDKEIGLILVKKGRNGCR
jgi:hypothetical protein